MTALDQYIRLEATGRWRETDLADWREVLVSFGNASLVLSDFDERPLTHWSLAAVERVDDGDAPALYAPDAGTAELLEIADPDMIGAIAQATQMARIRNHPVRPRQRARWLALGAALLALGTAAALHGPDLLRGRAFALITPEQAGLVSEGIRARLDAQVCTVPEGIRGLRRLAARVGPGARVDVMAWSAPLLGVLPDGSVLLGRSLVEKGASAEAVAGWIALGATAGPAASPLHDWVKGMDLGSVLAFLSSGEIGPQDMAGMAGRLRADGMAPTAEQVTAAATALAAQRIDPAPFLADVAARLPGLAVTHPAPAQSEPALARDQDWVALQNICGG